MEFLTWVLVFLVILVSSLMLWNKSSSGTKYSFPPGPFGLPLIGSPWYIMKDLHVVCTELSKVLGDVISINIFGQRMVVLNSPDTVRNAFLSQTTSLVFSGRSSVPPIHRFINDTTVFLQPESQWAKQRKLNHKILNMYGEGVREAEDVIHEELSHVTEWLEKRKGGVDLDDVIYPSLINILSSLLKGRRYDYGSRVQMNIQAMDESNTRAFSVTNNLILTLLPFMRYVPLGPGKNMAEAWATTDQFMKDFFDESKATYDPHVTRGMIDYLLHHQEETRIADGSTWLEDKSIKALIVEVIIAGSITTRASLSSFFLIITHKPEVARRIQEEIDAVIGHGRLVRIADRPDMPYTTAAILELLRYISHVPLGLPHVTTEDARFGEYFLQKDTTLFANPWCFHHDRTLWPDPWEFKPERFLDNNNKLVSADHPKRKNLLPFGIGRRSCVGETFARSRIFIFIVTLLQRFNFSRDPMRPLPPCDPRTYVSSVVLSPPQYYVQVTPRD